MWVAAQRTARKAPKSRRSAATRGRLRVERAGGWDEPAQRPASAARPERGPVRSAAKHRAVARADSEPKTKPTHGWIRRAKFARVSESGAER